MLLNLHKLPTFRNSPVTPVTPVTTNEDAGSACHQQKTPLVTTVTDCLDSQDFVTGENPVVTSGDTESSTITGLSPLSPLSPVKNDESEKVTASGLVLVQDPSYFEEDFSRWALTECLFLDRWAFSVKALHEAFSEWCLKQETIGCLSETFYALLDSEGFHIEGGLVQGLVLKSEVTIDALSRQKR